ncbi:uncharacterized protein LOC113781491 [Coffea eugenioides]|uniref:uncharacterized protein LOC113781491 n=1 Tax=Coffea eugenioides TaxID=49369 RepID=UPI000F609689|nr:uncharacterized protein LOC113781491 [Coffea eugenioides]
MDCIILPVAILRKCYSGSRLGYRQLTDDVFGKSDEPVTVVVGKEKREFLVEPFVLEESPFRVLIDMVKKENMGGVVYMKGAKRVIFVDVDAILFEHMLWLMQNDCSSFFQLNLKEIIDFYAQEN